jgi:subtilisin family serine protease
MKSRSLRPRPLALAVGCLVACAGLSVVRPVSGYVVIDESGHGIGPSSASIDHSAQAKYIVRFKEAPLALYDGSLPGLASIPQKSETGGRAKLDVHSAAAQAYVAYVANAQSSHVSAMNTLLGRTIPVEHQMQYAINAIVVTLSGDEAQKLAKLDGVAGVTHDSYQQLATDIGPGFIGAANIWWGASAGVDTLFAGGFDSNQMYRGEGVVIADVDTGYNSNSPSFAGTDDSGYAFINPLGANNYLGLCNPSSTEQPAPTLFTVPFAGCNNKVIGAYDFIDTKTPFSAEDYQGHGSHTASTAGGNTRNGTIGAYNARISGVAPHANMVIYYACSAAGCPTSSTTAAVDQAVQDSVIDALNFSISGGTDPWNDPTSLAFLGAADSGIFIAAAAGNTGTSVPNAIPGTANHLEPWVTTVAAANHTGGDLGYFLTVSGAGAPPPVGMNTAPGSTQPSHAITAASLKVSPNFSAANDCAAFPAGTFTGKFAIMQFINGPCGTNAMAANAKAAGAVDVLLVNQTDDYINSGAVQTIPVFTTTSVQGHALAAFVNANTSATANVSFPANTRLPVTPDSLASFSLLGPSTFDVIKPDVQAPGIAILAAFNNANANDSSNHAVPPSGANVLGFDDGTSMATPHTTGSGALMLGLHPDWTPMEAKSALMMTAKEAGLTKSDHVTPSDFYDRGAGRLQDDIAAKAGLVLNETGLNFLNADPSQGGDVRTLNLASMQNANCVTPTSATASTATCSFTRKFRSTQPTSVTYAATLTGVAGTVTPSSLAVVAHGTRSVDIAVDASTYASDGTAHFGELVLTPSDTTLPTLHLPIAIALQPPAISVSPAQVAISIAHGSTTKNATLTVTNTGGPTLTVSKTNDTAGNGSYVVLDQPSQGNLGDYSDFFPDIPEGLYIAEDFQTTAASTNLDKLSFPGFVTGATALSGFAGTPITFQIYTDNAGAPSGNPETVAPSYVWSYAATIGSNAGLNLDNNTISLDLVAAGAPPTALPPGRYWVTVFPQIPYGATGAGPWAWFESPVTFGNNAHVINPAGDFGIGTNWIAITDPANGDSFPGMAIHIEGQVPCGATWLSTSPSSLSLSGLSSAPVTVTADSTKFPGAATSANGFLCLDSNDAKFPVLAVPVSATQN